VFDAGDGHLWRFNAAPNDRLSDGGEPASIQPPAAPFWALAMPGCRWPLGVLTSQTVTLWNPAP
jgi:hypothetical protein